MPAEGTHIVRADGTWGLDAQGRRAIAGVNDCGCCEPSTCEDCPTRIVTFSGISLCCVTGSTAPPPNGYSQQVVSGSVNRAFTLTGGGANCNYSANVQGYVIRQWTGPYCGNAFSWDEPAFAQVRLFAAGTSPFLLFAILFVNAPSAGGNVFRQIIGAPATPCAELLFDHNEHEICYPPLDPHAQYGGGGQATVELP